MTLHLEGSYVALVTPFKDGKVDVEKIKALVERQVKGGMAGIVACGTTAETPTLSEDEQDLVIRSVVEAARGRLQVIAGTGSNNTQHVIERNKRVASLGVDGVLVVSPYYNKPTQEGLFQHFTAVAKATDLPIIVYNIQGRTGVNVDPATLARIVAAAPNVIGLKEASGNVDQMSKMVLSLPPSFAVLSGDDSYTLPCIAVGGKGVISTVGNIVPDLVVALTEAALGGDLATARKAHLRLFPLIRATFIETNPGPVKEALAMMGLIDAEWRLPMCGISESNRNTLRSVLAGFVPLDTGTTKAA
jgi:4-hydroxy-tetrahydrodipicolinate synthase